jgi:hypothetical protein
MRSLCSVRSVPVWLFWLFLWLFGLAVLVATTPLLFWQIFLKFRGDLQTKQKST